MKKIFVLISVLALLIAGYAGLSKVRTAESGEGKSEKPGKGRVLMSYVAAEGKVESIPGYEIEVGSEIEGKIAGIFVNEGDQVKIGDLLAQIENKHIQAKLNEAEAEATAARAKLTEVASGSRAEEIKRAGAVLDAALADQELAAVDVERYRRLFKQGIIAKISLDDKERIFKVAEAKVRAAREEKTLFEKGPRAETLRFYEDSAKRAEAAVEYYKKVLEKTYITASISGRIIRKYLEKGEMVSKDVQPYIVTVADVDKIRVNAEVDETDIGKLKIGNPVEITSYAYPGRVFKGVVKEIADYAGLRQVTPNNPAKNRDMKIVQVRIEFSEKTPLKLGMTVDVKIKYI